jgi:arylsulfatase A-like enzyme
MKIISRQSFLKRGVALLSSVFIMPRLLLKSKNNTNGNAKSPNILVIVTDQQNFKDLGAHGNPHLNTPHMDSLVKNGISFEGCYCTASVCGPSRSSLVSSRMPHETGVNYNEQAPKESIPNMGEIFREKGYRTIFIGKWHLPEPYIGLGFDSSQYPWPGKTDTIRGFEVLPYDYSTKVALYKGVGNDGPMASSVSDFLMNYKDDKPFLLYVCFNNPHDICYYPYLSEPSIPNDKNKLPPLPSNHAINTDESEFYKICRQRDHYGNQPQEKENMTTLRWQGYLHYYYRMTEEVDRAIGKVMGSLKKSGKEKDTLVICTSDHGDGSAAHKWAAKLSLYEEATNVPFIINWKGKIKPRKIDKYNLVSGLDLLPTILDFAEFEVPSSLRGLSLRSIIENPDKKFRDFVITELAPDYDDPNLMGRMVRTSQYKYNLFTIGMRNEELFDMYYDPGETKNLAYEPTMKEIKTQLRSILLNWMEETDDDFLKNMKI